MSERYPGGIITKNPATPTGPYESGTAPGIWTLEQQLQYKQQGVWPTAGLLPNYIEEVFSTWLYTGNDTSQTITNNIDLSTKGGLVWIKSRSGTYSTGYHVLNDTVRGAQKDLYTNTTGAQSTNTQGLTAFTSTGFSVGNSTDVNGGTTNMVSWTFREQAKFFDVVTYTGTGSNTTIAHNLGSVPGFIIVKRTDTTGAWQCYHRSLANTQYMVLNTTAAVATGATRWNSTTPTSTVFSIGTDATVNASGGTYVAYVFAHDAGGFGLTGTDNVISCGTFTQSSAVDVNVSLGYEPQWLLIKRSNAVAQWYLIDDMRGFLAGNNSTTSKTLYANLSNAEGDYTIQKTSTGFTFPAGQYSASAGDYIYIAIRRGPMKVPTSGTSVFTPALGVSTTPNMVAGFPVDSFLGGDRDTPTSTNWKWWDRLRGNVASLLTTTSAAEDTSEYNYGQFQSMTGFISGNYDASDKIGWMFRRAPGFFDEVICTQTGSAQNVTHNLGVAPELLILKDRTSAVSWQVGTQFTSTTWNNLVLNITDAGSVGAYNNYINAQPTSTVFRLGSSLGSVNDKFVVYLFATCAGVSKVGSYTGTGTTLQINCGFTAGSRFVMVKRSDSAGDWYVWDSARGITAGNDPYLFLNSTAVEVTGTDYVDTYSAGFEISSTAPAAINANGGTFIFLAIA
jgi:hypothetical protein